MAYGDSPVTLMAGTIAAMEAYGLGCVSGNNIILLDDGQAFEQDVIPACIMGSHRLRQGIEYLRTMKPRVVMLYSSHRGEGDVKRQLKFIAPYLRACPVVGVEMQSKDDLDDTTISPPKLQSAETPFGQFQRHQIAHFAKFDLEFLPCDPGFSELGEQAIAVGKLYADLRNGRFKGEPEVCSQLQYVAHASLHLRRSWGIISQFGWWLQHPRVTAMLQGHVSYIPLSLGSGHRLEHKILSQLFEMDVITINTSYAPAVQNVSYPVKNLEAALAYGELISHHVMYGRVPIQDMQYPFPH